jgi:hypothetical protein
MGFSIQKEKRRVLQDINVGLSPLFPIRATACDNGKFRMHLFLCLAVCDGTCLLLELEKTMGWEGK